MNNEWHPPKHKWLFVTFVKGRPFFYDIFDTVEDAIDWADRTRDIIPELWYENVSGDRHHNPDNSEYSYEITQEHYHG